MLITPTTPPPPPGEKVTALGRRYRKRYWNARGGREALMGRDCGTTLWWRGGSRGEGLPNGDPPHPSVQKDRVAQAHRAAVRPCLARDRALYQLGKTSTVFKNKTELN
jgi:hypothetical protein